MLIEKHLGSQKALHIRCEKRPVRCAKSAKQMLILLWSAEEGREGAGRELFSPAGQEIAI